MAAITRTLIDYELVAYTLNDDNPPVVEKYADMVIQGTKMSNRIARIAFRDAGVALPKNAAIKYREVGQHTYSLDIDKFIEAAEVVE